MPDRVEQGMIARVAGEAMGDPLFIDRIFDPIDGPRVWWGAILWAREQGFRWEADGLLWHLRHPDGWDFVASVLNGEWWGRLSCIAQAVEMGAIDA